MSEKDGEKEAEEEGGTQKGFGDCWICQSSGSAGMYSFKLTASGVLGDIAHPISPGSTSL